MSTQVKLRAFFNSEIFCAILFDRNMQQKRANNIRYDLHVAAQIIAGAL